jgi:uncharacterized protein
VPSPADELRVSALSLAPVKGLRIERVPRAQLDPDGLRGDRALFLVDARGRMLNGKQHGMLQRVTASLEAGSLTLALPDGSVLGGELGDGQPLQVSFHSRPREAHLVPGPFSAALSELVGEPVRLVAFAGGAPAVDRGRQGAVTLVSQASVVELGRTAGVALDARRFRMSIEIEGGEAFQEDGWLGSELHIGGDAAIRLKGHVGRCLVTSRDPETGAIDVPTLELLRQMRGTEPTTEPLAFGVYGGVLRGGEIAVGDEVRVVRR